MEPLPRKTRKAWDSSGHAHFVTYSCNQRWPLLNNRRARGWVLSAMENARQQLDLDLWAYVIMPEHAHVLLCPRDRSYEMRRILAALKRPVSKAAKEHLESIGENKWIELLSVEYPTRRVFRFWQPGGGFDRNIVHEKSVWAVMDYIHHNPVRRGLVGRAEDWEWSSARYWNGNTEGVMQMDRIGLR